MAASRWRAFVPLALCVTAVFIFSSQSYEQQTIVPWLARHLSIEQTQALLPDVAFRYGHLTLSSKAMPFHFIEFVLRKCAHVLLYTALGCCLYAAFRSAWLWRPRSGVLPLATVAGLTAVAAMDEWNQTRVSMRTGQFVDVVLDVAGGTIGACLVVALTAVFKKRKG